MIWLSQQDHAGVYGLGEPEAEQKALLLALTDRFVFWRRQNFGKQSHVM